MNAPPYVLPQLFTVVVVIIGAVLAHHLTVSRDLENRRREQRVGYMVNAYRALAKAVERDIRTVAHEIEEAIAAVQVFGTPAQIRLAQKFAGDLAGTGKASADELLDDLRQSLRRELGQEAVAPGIRWMTISRGSERF